MENEQENKDKSGVTGKGGGAMGGSGLGGSTPPPPVQPGAAQPQAAAAVAADEEGKMYALKVTVDGHEHAGQPVKNGATIMLDPAEYRWALQNKVGVKGNEADAGKEVDSAGEVITESTLAELEQKASEAV